MKTGNSVEAQWRIYTSVNRAVIGLGNGLTPTRDKCARKQECQGRMEEYYEILETLPAQRSSIMTTC